MHRSGMTLARLMSESSDCLHGALHSDNDVDQLVATRFVETPAAFERWESQHVTLMRGVAGYPALGSQITALKQTTLSLIHGKALFDYLKKEEIRGTQRTSLISHFYPTRGYTSAMVAAHGTYLRKTCSFLCTNHVGAEVVQDQDFIDPVQHYEDLYAEYFHLYCRIHIWGGVDSASEKSLLPLLKHQLGEWRWAILNPREAAPRVRREGRIRQATGDTQRLRALSWPKSRP